MKWKKLFTVCYCKLTEVKSHDEREHTVKRLPVNVSFALSAVKLHSLSPTRSFVGTCWLRLSKWFLVLCCYCVHLRCRELLSYC